jgi:salicylate hydroxylase
LNQGHIGIVGGGIGGLTATLSLQRAGIRVSVFERAEELREAGAGIVIAGPSMRCLDSLGVGDRIREQAGLRGRGYFDLRHFRTGELLQEAADTTGAKIAYAQHRADLQRTLLDSVLANDPNCVHLGCDFAGLDQDDEQVTVRFANGSSCTVDALVGADGVASLVRPMLFGPEPVVYTGMVSYRGLIPAERVTDTVRDMNGTFWVGPERMFLCYFVRGTDFMNIVAHARQPGWEEEGWSIPVARADLLGLYVEYCPEVHQAIEAIPEELLFKWALRDRPPMDQWTVGRVSLLGDAAHPMLPFLGQGGNMAIEDGTVLGRCFEAAADDVGQAFERYEKARKDWANTVQVMSRTRAETLMTFSDENELPVKSVTGGPPGYDPSTMPV